MHQVSVKLTSAVYFLQEVFKCWPFGGPWRGQISGLFLSFLLVKSWAKASLNIKYTSTTYIMAITKYIRKSESIVTSMAAINLQESVKYRKMRKLNSLILGFRRF